MSTIWLPPRMARDTAPRAKAAGKLVLSLVGSPKHAQGALTKPVDILVAQGYDAGAHTGTIGALSLVPQIVDLAGDVPVLAAGGVATGRHLLASLAMGAQGFRFGSFRRGRQNADQQEAAIEDRHLRSRCQNVRVASCKGWPQQPYSLGGLVSRTTQARNAAASG